MPPPGHDPGAAAALIAEHRRGDYSQGRTALRRELLGLFADTLVFHEKLTGSQWAEEFGRIPKGSGAESGPVTLYGYQRGLVDAMCDPRIPLLTVLKAARVGYTRCATLAIGYHLHHDPTLCAVAQPVKEDAEEFGGREIGPMLRETPVLKRLIRPNRKGEKPDKADFYQLSNGASVKIVGAASDDAFRRYSARFLFADELDAEGWTPGAKTQGDKLKLFWTRGETFWNRKLIRGGTPLLEETSRTWKLWLTSDQRRYFVPCPQCQEMQYLEWGGPDQPHGLKWKLDDAGRVKEVWYVCVNGCVIEEGWKAWMDARGEWRPTAVPDNPGHVGFHLWSGMSLTPNAAWPILVAEWLEALKDPATLVQPFVNLVRGMPYRPRFGQELKVAALAERVEPYPFEVPAGVRFLTAGGDVQSGEGKDPRVEVSVYGWGAGHEAWLIGHWIIRGDPAGQEVWRDVDELLARPFLGAGGKKFFIQAAALDSGGHHTQEVYAFTAARAARRVWAIKGRSETRGKRSPVWPRRPTVKNGATLYMVGGNAARDFVYRSLAITRPGPRFVHFPADPAAGSDPLDTEFFEQLTREKLIVPRNASFTEWHKPKDKPHEAGVCLVYAYAAVAGLQALNKRWRKVLEIDAAAAPPPQEAGGELEPPAPPAPADTPAAAPPPPPEPDPATQPPAPPPRLLPAKKKGIRVGKVRMRR